MSAALATAPTASARATASAFARGGSGKASAVRAPSASVPGRRSSLARRGAPQRRAAAVDVVEVEEEDEVSPTDSIDDDDLPFDLDEYKAVVKLLVTFQEPDWVNPWSNKTAQRSTGSGCVIRRHEKGGGGVILTAAHVVANATFIQVQLANSPDKHVGRVVSVLHEVDLALVEVGEGFYVELERGSQEEPQSSSHGDGDASAAFSAEGVRGEGRASASREVGERATSQGLPFCWLWPCGCHDMTTWR